MASALLGKAFMVVLLSKPFVQARLVGKEMDVLLK